MKKNYFKPEAEFLDVPVLCNIIETSGPGYEGGTGGKNDFNANKHRGEWGNVWGN